MILLISNGFQPSYEKAFSNGLARCGVQVELISSDRSLADQFDGRVSLRNLRGSQAPDRSRVSKAANLLRYFFSLLRYIATGRHEVVHLIGLSMDGRLVTGLFEFAAYRLLARRLFMTVHDLLPHNRHNRLNRWLCRMLYKIPHTLVVHTEKAKAGLIGQFGVPASRIVVMAHGVDDLPPRLGVPAPSPVLRLLMFGGLSRYKGADLLLDALQQCADLDVELVMAGKCVDQAYVQQIEQQVREVGARHRVRWENDFIAEERIASYFEAADAAVLPYRHIDQSGVLFTAFRFGTPVIATDVGPFREGLPDFAGLLVPEVSAGALALGLREFNRRKAAFDRARIRQHAQSMVWENTVGPLVQAYRRCA